MRLFLLILFIVGVAIGLAIYHHESKPFVGRVVYMEHIPKHMCHDEFTTTYRAAYIPTHVPHSHKEEPEQFLVYVGNKDGVRRFSVVEELYNSLSPGDKVSMDIK
jgi:hypothetical protein